MTYGDDVTFGLYNHIPDCRAQIDTTFDVHAVNLCVSGRIHFQIDDDPPQTLAGPVFWWTWPGPRFRYGALPGEFWDHYYVTFAGQRADSLAAAGVLARSAPGVRLLASSAACEHAFRELIHELDADPSSAVAANLLDRLSLLSIRDALQPAPATPRERALSEIAAEIEADPAAPWQTNEIAGRLAVSEGHLRRLFSQQFGCPPHQFIIRQRLRLAATLLRTTNAPVKQIAAACGMDDLAYFSRQFRKRYSLPPAAYRNQSQLRTGPEVTDR